MATSTVSASINTETKTIVSHHLAQAGTTANEVIRSLWNYIAATGKIPRFDAAPEQESETGNSQTFQHLMELRSRTPHGTPLAHMTAADIKRELMMRDV